MASFLTGNWNRMTTFVKNIAVANSNKLLEKELLKLADKIIDQVKANIENQSMPLEPLDTYYKEWKIANNYDERILIKTGDLMDSIQVSKIIRVGSKLTIQIEPVGHGKDGIDLARLLYAIEYGFVPHAPERPIVRLTWEHMREDVKKDILTAVFNAISTVGLRR